MTKIRKMVSLQAEEIGLSKMTAFAL